MIKLQNDNLKWFNEINKESELVLTGDLDSLLSCLLIQKETGAKITTFYNFYNLYETTTNRDKYIGVDCDLVAGKCIANHTTPYVNPECVGFNQTINTKGNNYYNKFAGSTFLTLLYLYEYDFSKFSEEQIKLIISIDSGYLQYYKYRDKWNHWYNNIMGIGQYIEPVLEKYTLEDMETYNNSNNLKSTININKENLLYLSNKFVLIYLNFILADIFPIKLPKNTFTKNKDFKIKYGKSSLDDFINILNDYDVFSWAQTFKNTVQYSYFV